MKVMIIYSTSVIYFYIVSNHKRYRGIFINLLFMNRIKLIKNNKLPIQSRISIKFGMAFRRYLHAIHEGMISKKMDEKSKSRQNMI